MVDVSQPVAFRQKGFRSRRHHHHECYGRKSIPPTRAILIKVTSKKTIPTVLMEHEGEIVGVFAVFQKGHLCGTAANIG